MIAFIYFFRYHGDWRSETQTVVSLIAFMHWLETGNLLAHSEAEEKLGCMLPWIFAALKYDFSVIKSYLLVVWCSEQFRVWFGH